MRAVCVTSNITLGALARVLAAKGKHITTMTAPIRADIGQGLETMRDAMVNLLFVSVLSGRAC